MTTEPQVIEALRRVQDPELHRDVISLGMIKEVKVSGEGVSLTLVLTTPACPVRKQFEADVRAAVEALPGVKRVDLSITAQVRSVRAFEGIGLAGVRNVVAIASGKGGVGKTTVSVNIAVALAQQGARVGLMDADIYGPNVPMMLGLTALPAMKGDRMVPAENFGVKVISMGFLVKPGEAVIWRGPMLHGAVNKFLKEVEWGELDYLLVDLPPGCLTADTLVSTDRGPVPIGEVKEGMRVYSFDGGVRKEGSRPSWRLRADLVRRKVLAVIPQGKAKVYALRTATRTLKGTEDHPLLVLRRTKTGNERCHHYSLEWKKLASIQSDDRILVVKKLPQDQGKPLELPSLHSGSNGRNPVQLPTHTSDGFMRLLGYFLGDGSVRLSNGKFWGVWFSEPKNGKYRSSYMQLLKESFGLHRIHERPEKFAVLSARVAELFERLGFHKGALEKAIPAWVFGLPSSQKRSLIEGYCDADGHRRKETAGHRRAGWMCFESPNRQLIGDMRSLSMDVGLKVGNLNHRSRTICVPSTRKMLTRTFWGFEANQQTKTSVYGAGFIRGKTGRTIGKGLINEYVGFEKVRSIEPIGTEEVYDLHVEGEHNFVANGFIVHNTGDIQLSLSQVIALSGVLIVTTPQDVALADVTKSIAMFRKVNVPLLGLVENMSTFICPHCRAATEIFDKGGGKRAAEALKIPFLAEIPLQPEVRVGSDNGHPVVLTHPGSSAGVAFTEAAQRLAAQVSILAAQREEGAKTVWKV